MSELNKSSKIWIFEKAFLDNGGEIGSGMWFIREPLLCSPRHTLYRLTSPPSCRENRWWNSTFVQLQKFLFLSDFSLQKKIFGLKWLSPTVKRKFSKTSCVVDVIETRKQGRASWMWRWCVHPWRPQWLRPVRICYLQLLIQGCRMKWQTCRLA